MTHIQDTSEFPHVHNEHMFFQRFLDIGPASGIMGGKD